MKDPMKIAFLNGDIPIREAGLLRVFPAWRTTDLSIILSEKKY